MIGAQWAETGAGKKQHDIQVAEEKRVLAEAAAKEKADEEREEVLINTPVKLKTAGNISGGWLS